MSCVFWNLVHGHCHFSTSRQQQLEKVATVFFCVLQRSGAQPSKNSSQNNTRNDLLSPIPTLLPGQSRIKRITTTLFQADIEPANSKILKHRRFHASLQKRRFILDKFFTVRPSPSSDHSAYEQRPQHRLEGALLVVHHAPAALAIQVCESRLL